MLLYAWKVSGYSLDKPVSRFKNVLKINFGDIFGDCKIENCRILHSLAVLIAVGLFVLFIAWIFFICIEKSWT